jgi:predicted acetyltransferase
MDLEVRRLRPGEETRFVSSVRVPFLDPGSDDPGERLQDQRHVRELEVDRAWVAEDRGRFVANAAIASLDLTLPAPPDAVAPVTPFAGVTAVGVHPTHRRRGLLRRLMAGMLEDARARREAFAGSIASESGIYGRFGFGEATSAAEVRIDTRDAAMLVPPPRLDIRLVDAEEASKVLPDLFERQRRVRAGEPGRNAIQWEERLSDPAPRRQGANALFHAVCDEGYVSYRVHDADILRGDRCRLLIEELRGLTPAVEAGLWQFVLNVDLVGEVRARRRPIDDPLRWRLADPRRLRVTDVIDWLYLRILDVPAALQARGYRRAGGLVLDVLPPGDDIDGQPDPAPGRWALDADPGGAECRAARPGETADLRLSVTELGAIYLGGVSPSLLAAAGRIEEVRPGSLDRADALFATSPAPLTGTGF